MALLGSIFTIRCQIRARDSWIVLTCLASCAFWKWEMFIAEQWSAYHKKIRGRGFITHQAGAELFFSLASLSSVILPSFRSDIVEVLQLLISP